MNAQRPARDHEARHARSAGPARAPKAEHDDPVANLLVRVRDALAGQDK
jgi:hypothetical protein